MLNIHPRRYWLLIPIAVVFGVAVHQEWLNKTTPQPPLSAAAPQIPALAATQPPIPSVAKATQPQQQNATAKANATPLLAAGVFTYSNQCVERESDDWSGLRITLLPHGTKDHLWVVVWVEDEAPFLTFGKVDTKSGAIGFEGASEGQSVTRIKGVVDAENFRGTLNNSPITLPAIRNSETKTPYCGAKN